MNDDNTDVTPTLQTYNKVRNMPFGKALFMKGVCLKAPYFKTIKPQLIELRKGYCEVGLKNRRAVENHIHTVHAIAMGNLCELAMGLLAEATIPPQHRWIPKSMNIEYLQKAETNLRATATLDDNTCRQTGEIPVVVDVMDNQGVQVVRATITVWVTEKK